MLKGIVKFLGGDTHKRTMESLFPLVDEINALEAQFEALSDEALRAKTHFILTIITADHYQRQLLRIHGEGGCECIVSLRKPQ